MNLYRSLLGASTTLWVLLVAIALPSATHAGSTHPFFRRTLPTTQDETRFDDNGFSIDLEKARMPDYPAGDAVPQANALRDARAAAIVRNLVAFSRGINIWPATDFNHPQDPFFTSSDLLELKFYDGKAPTIYLPRSKCLGLLAYQDYFPNTPLKGLRSMVSTAILAASPGWCGTFGPGVDGAFDVAGGNLPEGNYDMTEMHLLQIAYCYYDELTPPARELLIGTLLANGRIHRLNEDDIFTSGGVPDDWSRAGYVSPLGAHKNFGETENHILMIVTARYLTNQLLYQRRHDISEDNRRNGGNGRADCIDVVLGLLQDMLRNDFSEYNAKNYQEETRWALLNLASFAYDQEVRLAARMVLDYLAARQAVSSNDLRRMVPFRRRNEAPKNNVGAGGAMAVGLVDSIIGADPMVPYYAFQAGNTRAFATENLELLPGDNPNKYTARPWKGRVADDAADVIMEVTSTYRLPPMIHDLFVNDLNRRFFQRLHRSPQPLEPEGGRNTDNMEIYAGSPSYLITAGGVAATYAIDPHFAGFVFHSDDQAKQLGVAVTTSFMATGQAADPGTQNMARDLIQFGAFSSNPPTSPAGAVENYGVAPDFACGFRVALPEWVHSNGERSGKYIFVDRSAVRRKDGAPAGFYLALYQETEGGFATLEAFDTWLHPELKFADFKASVMRRNPGFHLSNNIETAYTTQNGNRLHFVVWDGDQRDGCRSGARMLRVEYGPGDPNDALGDAGATPLRFLNGTILNSPAEAVVVISNPALGQQITLDMHDHWHPRRISETGEVEEAGSHQEVWVDFSAGDGGEGDFCRPYNRLAAAVSGVAAGGVLKIQPGEVLGPIAFAARKPITLIAPIGGVILGAHH